MEDKNYAAAAIFHSVKKVTVAVLQKVTVHKSPPRSRRFNAQEARFARSPLAVP
jgi:hypothetical protein